MNNTPPLKKFLTAGLFVGVATSVLSLIYFYAHRALTGFTLPSYQPEYIVLSVLAAHVGGSLGLRFLAWRTKKPFAIYAAIAFSVATISVVADYLVYPVGILLATGPVNLIVAAGTLFMPRLLKPVGPGAMPSSDIK